MFRRAVKLFWTRALLVLDALKWWHDTRELRQRRNSLPPKTLLIVDLMTMIASVKAQALFAAALRSRGYRPVVLLSSPAPFVQKLYSATGAIRFIYLEEYLTAPVREKALAETEDLMRRIPDLGKLVELEIGGYRTGRNVQSYVVRRFRTGRPDSGNEAQRAETKRLLAEALAVRSIVPRLLADIAPDLALFNERGYSPAGDLFDGCLVHGVDAIQWMGAPQSDHLLFKRYRLENRDTHPLALSDESWARLQDVHWTPELGNRLMTQLTSHYESGAWYNRQQLQEGKVLKSRAQIQRQLGLDPAKKTAVIFAHILYDATFFFGTSMFSDYETWLIEAVRCAMANPSLNWIVKVHPVNVWRSRMDGVAMEQLEVMAINRALGPLPAHIKILPADTDINTLALYQAIDYGLTVRGTPGMELPCFGVPVITAGTGRYSGRGFTIDPATPEEFRATLARLQEIPTLDEDTVRVARLYAFATFFMRPMPIQSFHYDYNARTFGLSELTYNVFLRRGVGSHLEATPDMGKFAEWAGTSTDADLLNWKMVSDSRGDKANPRREAQTVPLNARETLL
jgi:hypothetical protein